MKLIVFIELFNKNKTDHDLILIISESQTDNKFCRSFRAKITPGDNESAEDELKKEIR